MVGGRRMPLCADALLPRQVTGAGDVVDPRGLSALAVMGRGGVLNGCDVVAVKKFDKCGSHFFLTFSRWVELTIPVTAKIGGVFDPR